MKGRPLLVTAALIRDGDRILIAQRQKDSRFEPNKWEFPGGKVDFGEHPEESLTREIEEELGIAINVGPLYSLGSHVYERNGMTRHVVILFYRCGMVGGRPVPVDVQDLRWVTREELSSYTYVDGDNPVVSDLVGDDGFWIQER